jgi:hypothetical protein
VNNHKTIRQILGHGLIDDQQSYCLQTLKDNVSLLTPEILDRINQVVVHAGHDLIKKNQQEADLSLSDEPALTGENLQARCDSFVVETNVEYPTDVRLLFEASRKVIELLIRLCRDQGVEETLNRSEIKKLKKLWRKLQKLKHSTAKDESKRAARQKEIVAAYQAYLNYAQELLEGAEKKLEELEKKPGVNQDKVLKIKEFMQHAWRQIDQTNRRAIQGQKIPHEQKVFFYFRTPYRMVNKRQSGSCCRTRTNGLHCRRSIPIYSSSSGDATGSGCRYSGPLDTRNPAAFS